MTTRFLGVELELAPGVLRPREETELLGRSALELIAGQEQRRVIDMCCGSGNLACAIAAARPGLALWAADLTDDCVALARRNVARLALGERVRVYQGDLFAALDAAVASDASLPGSIDLIVCNPPYISTGRLAKDSAHLLEHEPREAFDGGPYGLTIHQRVIKAAPAWLRPGGWLLFEIGLGQEKQLGLLFARSPAFSPPRFIANEAGAPRVVAAQLAP
jgi:release factor glutamine methyltransferase